MLTEVRVSILRGQGRKVVSADSGWLGGRNTRVRTFDIFEDDIFTDSCLFCDRVGLRNQLDRAKNQRVADEFEGRRLCGIVVW